VEGALCVRKRFAEIRVVVQFARFENLAAIETFDVLRIVVFGDQAGPGVLTGGIQWVRHGSFSTDLSAL
jgi:hypothetical protein